jgi:hypothetical protein
VIPQRWVGIGPHAARTRILALRGHVLARLVSTGPAPDPPADHSGEGASLGSGPAHGSAWPNRGPVFPDAPCGVRGSEVLGALRREAVGPALVGEVASGPPRSRAGNARDHGRHGRTRPRGRRRGGQAGRERAQADGAVARGWRPGPAWALTATRPRPDHSAVLLALPLPPRCRRRARRSAS